MKIVDALATLAVIVAVVAALALSLGLSSFCHRVVGPIVTGSSDPLVVATYCRPRG